MRAVVVCAVFAGTAAGQQMEMQFAAESVGIERVGMVCIVWSLLEGCACCICTWGCPAGMCTGGRGDTWAVAC